MTDIGDIRLNIILSVAGQSNLAALNSGIAVFGANQVNIFRTTQQATGGLEKQRTTFQRLTDSLSQAEVKYDAIFRASYRLQIVGQSLLNVTEAITGTVSDLTTKWGDFEFMVNRAAGALQIWKGATADVNTTYDGLIDRIITASKDLRLFPANDVAKATYFWASTSGQAVNSLADLDSVMRSVTPIMKAAALTQTDFETAIKGTYSILVQYGRPLSDVGDITQKLFLVTQRTALEFPDLINSFKYVGPLANQLGVSFEEVAQTLGQLGDAGIRSTMAGRALRQLFIQSLRPTAKAQDALDSLFKSTKGIGKTFQEVIFPNGKFIGITNYVHLLAVALQDATVAARGHLLATITTANELPVLTALVGSEIDKIKGLPGAYDAAKSSVQNSADAADQFNRSWSLLADSWKGLTGRVTEGIEAIRLRLGRVIADALVPTTKAFTELLDKIELWVKKNPQIVETITRWAGFVAIFTAVAGAALILAGSLLGLIAAVGVVVEGLGKLITPFAGLIGIMILFGEQIIKNWTYIKNKLGPSIRALAQALGLANVGVSDLKKSWDGLHSTIENVVNIILHLFVGALKVVLDLFTAIERSPLKGVIEAVGKFIVLYFGLSTLRTILSLVAGFLGLSKVAAGLMLVLKGLPILLSTVRGGITGVGLSLKALFLASPLIVITALVTAIQALADVNFLGIGDFFRSLTHNIDDVKAHIEDLRMAAGKGGNDIQTAMDRAIEATSHYGAQIDATRLKLSHMVNVTKGRAKVENDLNKLLESQAKDTAAAWDMLQAKSDDLGISLSDFTTEINKWNRATHLGFWASVSIAETMDKAFGDTVPTVKEAISVWNQFGSVFHGSISPENFLRLTVSPEDIRKAINDAGIQDKIAEAMRDINIGRTDLAAQILLPLKTNSSNYTDETNQIVENLLGNVPVAIKGVMEDAAAAAEKGPSEIIKGLTDGIKSLGDIKKNLEAALKGTLSPKDLVKLIFGKDTLSSLKKGWLSDHLGMADWTTAQIQDINTTVTTAIAAAENSGDTVDLAKAIIAAYTKTKLPKNLPPEFKADVQEWVDWAYLQLPNTPSPKATTATRPRAGFRETSYPVVKTIAKDSVAQLVAGMKTSWTNNGGQAFLDGIVNKVLDVGYTNLYSGGYNTLKSWFEGIQAAWNKYYQSTLAVPLTKITRMYAGDSPPPEGPLKNIDTGGYNVGRAWADGIIAGATTAISGTRTVTGLLNSGLYQEIAGMTGDGRLDYSVNNARHVTVDVNVSSKDGSVSGLDMKQLADSLTPVLREAAHMASVN